MALWNYCTMCGKRIEVGEPCLGIEKENTEIVGDSICFDCVKVENINGIEKTVSITDLLARAEAAEARVRELETRFRTEKCENGPECAELGRVRKALAEAEARAEKAEEIASDLCDDFTDFVTGGIHNAAPYCANCRPECVNAHGWCNGDNKVCRGFMPKAAVWKEE